MYTNLFIYELDSQLSETVNHRFFFFYLLLFFFLVSVWASSLLSKQESFLPLPTYTSAIEMSANAFGKKEDFDH